jgi:ATP-dependent Clp protease adaptor protein ClpS
MKYVAFPYGSLRINVFPEPSLYQVILHNDGFTPMEFVVEVLEKIFYMDRLKASETMLKAHIEGKAVCGMFTKDLALSKLEQVELYVKWREHPLTCSMEVANTF